MGLGVAMMIAFVLTPLGAACAWLFGEGMVRASRAWRPRGVPRRARSMHACA